ncbi:MAG: hypothetical protein KKF44_11130 [Nanoarchaeota archaeon]|nr:hypothetical protein [Nanoarchaeota archaeon]
MIIIGGGRLFLRYVMHIKPQKTSLGAKMIIGIIILTPIYVTGGISVMKEANSSRPGILSMILFFYFLSIAFYSVFINLEHVHKKLH